MATSFEKTIDNYQLLYELFSDEPYKQKSSFTMSTTFVADDTLSTPKFVQEQVINKSVFVLNPEWCR